LGIPLARFAIPDIDMPYCRVVSRRFLVAMIALAVFGVACGHSRYESFSLSEQGRRASFVDRRGTRVTVTIPALASGQLVTDAEALRTRIGTPAVRAYVLVHIDARRSKGTFSVPPDLSSCLVVRSRHGRTAVAVPAASYFTELLGVLHRQELMPAQQTVTKFSPLVRPGGEADALFVISLPGDPTKSVFGATSVLASTDPIVGGGWRDAA
jgi:hypothetical protein